MNDRGETPGRPRFSTQIVKRLLSLRRAHRYDEMVRQIPYAEWLGYRVEEVDGRPRGCLPFSDALVGNPRLPALHGGALGALLELTAVFTVLWSQDSTVLPKTINLTVDYLRSARPIDTFAEATVTKHGRRVVNVRAEAWQEERDRPVALAYAHFLVLPQTDPDRSAPEGAER